ncbi:MAG: hypothetical protein SGILL_002821 [Bacillariaceae sp.]
MNTSVDAPKLSRAKAVARCMELGKITSPIPKSDKSTVGIIVGSSVYDEILPKSIAHRQGDNCNPLVSFLKVGFDQGKPSGWHRNEERAARGLIQIDKPATQLENWERELVFYEILVLSGAPGSSFRHLARAWARDKAFHTVLANYIFSRFGSVERKRRPAANVNGGGDSDGAKKKATATNNNSAKRRKLLPMNTPAADIGADVWDSSQYGNVDTNEALAVDIFDFSEHEYRQAAMMSIWVDHADEAAEALATMNQIQHPPLASTHNGMTNSQLPTAPAPDGQSNQEIDELDESHLPTPVSQMKRESQHPLMLPPLVQPTSLQQAPQVVQQVVQQYVAIAPSQLQQQQPNVALQQQVPQQQVPQQQVPQQQYLDIGQQQQAPQQQVVQQYVAIAPSQQPQANASLPPGQHQESQAQHQIPVVQNPHLGGAQQLHHMNLQPQANASLPPGQHQESQTQHQIPVVQNQHLEGAQQLHHMNLQPQANASLPPGQHQESQPQHQIPVVQNQHLGGAQQLHHMNLQPPVPAQQTQNVMQLQQQSQVQQSVGANQLLQGQIQQQSARHHRRQLSQPASFHQVGNDQSHHQGHRRQLSQPVYLNGLASDIQQALPHRQHGSNENLLQLQPQDRQSAAPQANSVRLPLQNEVATYQHHQVQEDLVQDPLDVHVMQVAQDSASNYQEGSQQ